MEIFAWLVAVAFVAALCVFIYLKTPASSQVEASATPKVVPDSSALIAAYVALGPERQETASSGISDKDFERIFEESFGHLVSRHFYVKVAGTSHRNSDRTSRTKVIRGCTEFDALTLTHDIDNKFSERAIEVKREDGSQLGFLPQATADEVYRNVMSGAKRYLILFRHPNFHPDTGKVVGAVILICEMLADAP